MEPVKIDFATYSNEVLCASYLRINRVKYPENFAAAEAEIARRNLPIPTASTVDEWIIPSTALDLISLFSLFSD